MPLPSGAGNRDAGTHGTGTEWRALCMARHTLWRAVGQDGDTLDILRQSLHDRTAVMRCFCKLLKGLCSVPRVIITDTLKCDEAATRDILSGIEYQQHQGLTDQDELLHQPTRQKERQVRICNPLVVMHRQWLYVHGVGLLPV